MTILELGTTVDTSRTRAWIPCAFRYIRAAALNWQLRLGASLRYLQIREVPFRAGPHPKGYRTLGVTKLHIVDNQARLRCPMNEESCLCPVHHDAVLRPYARLKVHVRFVLLRRFLPQPVEIELWLCAVLGGMVAPHLIVRPPVRRPAVDVLVAVPLYAERHP